MINIDNINVYLLCLDVIRIVRDVNIQIETELEEDENALGRYRVSANESTLISTFQREASEESITMAPRDGVTQFLF